MAPLPAPQPDFERVRRALLRDREPDRVPLFDLSVDPGLMGRFLGRPIRTVSDEVEFAARFGYDCVRAEQGLQQFVKRQAMTRLNAAYGSEPDDYRDRDWAPEGRGLITNREEFDQFPWPDPETFDYSRFDALAAVMPPGMRTVATLGKVFTTAWWLMGFEVFCLALVEDPELVAMVFERVGETQIRVLEKMLTFPKVGAVWHADDLAYTESLMVQPKSLREHVFPWYHKMQEICQARGVPMIFHSDGRLDEVLDDILAVGFAGLNPIEPKAMDIVKLKRDIGSRICLIGNIDLGYTLTRGTPEETREEVKLRIRQCAPGGGYCVASSNSVPEYVLYDNFVAMRDATLEYGSYPIRL